MPDYSEQIDKALKAHGSWKMRLNSAIANGTSEFTTDQAQADNRCEFGKWLYSLPPEIRATEEARTTQTLHAQFHGEAARILDLALKGRKDEATKALGPGEKYASLSGKLALGMRRWETTLKA